MTKSEKTVAKKTDTAKAAPAKTAAKSTATKKAAPAKTAAKASAKTAAVKKKAVKKPKFATADEMCAKLKKLIKNDKAKAVKTNVAVDIEVWGLENDTSCHMYIEIKDGVLDVQPYRYNSCSFEAYINYENMMKLLDGKLTLKEAVSTGALNANGNIPAAIAVASIF
ncbi:MAG: SCP2 sterol-binding domain-containing protein [Oscillospiraceae bacterium]|nr:SCP2 sterol-binding domain-containing protein [Oscillospiraceae bacterium]